MHWKHVKQLHNVKGREGSEWKQVTYFPASENKATCWRPTLQIRVTPKSVRLVLIRTVYLNTNNVHTALNRKRFGKGNDCTLMFAQSQVNDKTTVFYIYASLRNHTLHTGNKRWVMVEINE